MLCYLQHRKQMRLTAAPRHFGKSRHGRLELLLTGATFFISLVIYQYRRSYPSESAQLENPATASIA
jgi:hypothetical protein